MNYLNQEELILRANTLRQDILKMLNCAGSGHCGGSLSEIDILTVLYNNIMNHDSENPDMEDRDMFILSKGHSAPALYAVLADCGYFDKSELSTLRQFGSSLQGHPSMHHTPGVEVSTGSLGQGLSIAVGVALANKMDQSSARTYCLMGDGEIQEGQIWEAAMAAGHHKLGNLCGILDNNGLQIDGKVEDVMDVNPIKEKWEAFNWNVIEVDGHDVSEIEEAFKEAKNVSGKPSLILAKTIKGKGVSFMENKPQWHGLAPDEEQLEKALCELNCEDDNLSKE